MYAGDVMGMYLCKRGGGGGVAECFGYVWMYEGYSQGVLGLYGSEREAFWLCMGHRVFW